MTPYQVSIAPFSHCLLPRGLRWLQEAPLPLYSDHFARQSEAKLILPVELRGRDSDIIGNELSEHKRPL